MDVIVLSAGPSLLTWAGAPVWNRYLALCTIQLMLPLESFCETVSRIKNRT